jgi:hypothetical protein
VPLRQKLGARRAFAGTLKCGSHRVLDVLSSFTPRGYADGCTEYQTPPGASA